MGLWEKLGGVQKCTACGYPRPCACTRATGRRGGNPTTRKQVITDGPGGTKIERPGRGGNKIGGKGAPERRRRR